MRQCPTCNEEYAIEEKKVHPISKDEEILYSFKCGKKIKMIRYKQGWVPIELSACGKGVKR